jgi:transmembrane sensor
MQVPAHIQALVEKLQSGTATEEELRQLRDWYHSFDDSEAEILSAAGETEQDVDRRIKDRLLQTIREDRGTPVRRMHRWRLPAAAAVLILLVAVYLYRSGSGSAATKPLAEKSSRPVPELITPGGNKALLTLGDGSSIVLDAAADGTLDVAGSVKVVKLTNGQLAYTINDKAVSEKDPVFYNTITTPRGGQYQVTLSDGTKVWLNAASSIRFPVAFGGGERRVQLTGEAYFEVARNKQLPFRVEVAGTEVEVLGTHFNVNAYADEASVKTTLLEGLVKVSAPQTTQSKFIQPGQQASVNREGGIEVDANANLEEAVAWKNGRFHFERTDIRAILRQISRWYDVDVVYEGNVSLHFSGQLSRNEPVDTIFKKLELTDEVHIRTKGKTIIVSP